MSSRVVTAALSTLLSSCIAEEWPAPPPVDVAVFAAEHAEWREYRRGRLVTPPSGPLLWIGLWELEQGANPFGSDTSLALVLPPADSPPLAGTLHRSGQEIRLEPAPGADMNILDGDPITDPILLGSDRSDDPTTVELGSLGMRIHGEPGTDRLWLRVWDTDLPVRDTFALPESFPVDTAWRVAARFEPYAEPITLTVADVTAGTIEYRVPGELVFQLDGREHSLIATAGETSTSFFVLMWDSTATTETYQAGRYLRVDFPDEEGWTTIDFNRAYNAPCVFTPFSVCGLPPRENWLQLAVTAGEKRPAVPVY
ncbi:MAG: DUF1684 domain-containing protein [Gemmatimonadetes bacterium]|nr:DUF1684 domain-containing protein [Gemmatimonadota bacterium]